MTNMTTKDRTVMLALSNALGVLILNLVLTVVPVPDLSFFERIVLWMLGFGVVGVTYVNLAG